MTLAGKQKKQAFVLTFSPRSITSLRDVSDDSIRNSLKIHLSFVSSTYEESINRSALCQTPSPNCDVSMMFVLQYCILLYYS